jgi:hypothetical protein
MSKNALLVPKEPRLTTPENKQEGILSWDVDNNYPARMRGIVADSVTAQNCLKVYNRFVMGLGLADETLRDSVVNLDGETANKVIRKSISDKGFIGAVAIHINYNAEYKKVEVRHIRIDDVRLAIDKKKVAVHPNWEKRADKKKFKKSEIEFYHLFDESPEAIQAQVDEAGGWDKYTGQILFWSPLGVEYTTAPYDATAEDMQTEAGIKTFNNRIVGQNFMPSQYIIVDDIETVDEEDELGEDDVTARRRGAESQSFSDVIVGAVKQYQGAENAGSVMVIQKPSPETTFELKTPDLQHFDGMYEKTEKSKDNAILRGFMMPRPLILEGGDALFASGEILESAQNYYNVITEDDRAEIAELSELIFSNFETELCPSENYGVLPLVFRRKITQEYFPYYTKNEIRKSLGDEPVEESDADKKLLVETIGVNGTQSLVSILTDAILTPDQKRGTLKVLFNFTDQEVDTMLNQNTLPNAGTDNP